MTNATRKCPSCGAQSGGKFCSECGAPLGPRACPQCGAAMSPRAKFCPECGHAPAPGQAAAAGAGAGAGAAGRLPWIIAGVALLAVMAAVIAIVSKRGDAPAAPFAQGGAGAPATTDITSMSPREAADRLFNRVMMASENGDTGQVAMFGPMTVQAYAMVDPLDVDGRMHVASVQLLLGDAPAAAAQADTIARASGNHLFASLLRARAAELERRDAEVRRQWGRFLDDYDAERAKNLDEYTQHETMLTQARDAAKRLLNR